MFCVGLCIAQGRDSPRKFVVIVLTVYVDVNFAVHVRSCCLFDCMFVSVCASQGGESPRWFVVIVLTMYVSHLSLPKM